MEPAVEPTHDDLGHPTPPPSPVTYQAPGHSQQSDHPQRYSPGVPAGLTAHFSPDNVGPPPEDPLVPADFGGWFRRVVAAIKQNFVTLAGLQLITALATIVMGIATAGSAKAFLDQSEALKASTSAGTRPDWPHYFTAAVGYTGAGTAEWLVTTATTAFVLTASLFIVFRRAEGHPATAEQSIRFASKRAWPLACWLALAGILVAIGSIFLIIPGLWLAVVLFSSLPGIAVIERQGIGRCFDLINGRFWATTGRMLVVALTMGIYWLAQYGVGLALGGGPTSVPAIVVNAILAIPLSITLVAVAAVTYAELRFHQDPTTTAPRLVAEMLA
jgi:hypothetical protein